MKSALAPMTTLLALAALFAPAVASVVEAKTATPRTITQVVDLLESMMEKSKADGNAEREMYAKYKCYCDTNEEAKTSEIASLTEEISILESKIEELQASTGVLSKQVAKLTKDMAENEASRNESTTIRDKENTAFIALKDDLEAAIDQMDQAVQVLADIGADQSLGKSAADHEFMMAGQSLLAKKLQKSVSAALVAANSMVTKKQRVQIMDFLQAPFTGTYTAQSGEVVGILKDMRDTFKANLATATATEATALKAYNKFMKTAQEAYDEMDASHTTKQGELGSNDGELSTKKTQLSDAETDKESAETFLEELQGMCADKAKEYKNRVMLRSNEEAAIAEAISILNSDAAFATFGSVDATSTGATKGQGAQFLQRASIRRHRMVAMSPAVVEVQRKAAQQFLASKVGKSSKIAKVAQLLQAKNPFAVVLDEIKKMISLIAEEEKKDDEQKAFCDEERRVTKADIGTKTGQITSLEGEITALEEEIDHPITGLKKQISTDESLLEENLEDQKTETADRTEDNLAYQKNIANLVEAEALLEKATAVLRKYYAKIEASALVQKKKKQPEPPSTWEEGGYKGQSEAGGTSAISMLEFILSETQKEQADAHDAEKVAQHAFEDSMATLKTNQESLVKSIATLKQQLATKEEELLSKKADLEATKKEKATLEAYLLKIKPGCDFITDNIDMRKAARIEEKAALENAAGLIKGTPAYAAAEAEKHQESLGECKETCAPSEAHVDCKACLAETSVPGYCAGHPGTEGC